MRNIPRVIALFAVLILVFSSTFIAGCGQKGGSKTSETSQSEPATETGSGSEAEEKAERLAVGDKTTVGDVEITVEKTAVTNDLASAEANAELLTGEPGESPNASKSPAAGNEFLMITFKVRNTAIKIIAAVVLTNIKLENADGQKYTEVETSGYGAPSTPNRSRPARKHRSPLFMKCRPARPVWS